MPGDILRKNSNATIQLQSDDPLEFILSDATPDRHGDIVNPYGLDYNEFLTNPIALLNHDHNFAIGRWVNVRREKGALRAHLQMAPPGTSSRIDEVRKLLFSGIYRACSIGFQEIESEPRANGGKHYKRAKLLEASVVSVPSNPSALRDEARLLGISEATIKALIDKPPVNASFSQRADFARRSTMKKTESINATMRRINAKVRATMAARQHEKDREHDEFTRKFLACGDNLSAQVALMAEEHEKSQRLIDKGLKQIERRQATRLENEFTERVKQGADPQDLMRQFFHRANRRG